MHTHPLKKPARTSPPAADGRADAAAALRRYRAVRAFTERLCEPLTTEDYVVQTMEDVSPTKWHLAHVSWFFETFVLREHLPDYRPIDPRYAYLFNSYYVQAGERHCRDRRGYISRPTVERVFAYREHVDEQVTNLLETADAARLRELWPLIEIGLHHEQQHQELMLTDIKHVFSVNPLRPAYVDSADAAGGHGPAAGSAVGAGPDASARPRDGAGAEKHARAGATSAPPLRWVGFDEGLYEIGHDGSGFAYDNEGPRHRYFVDSFRLADRLVTNGEFLEFMEDGGYRRPELWLSAGWALVEERGWSEPFYWEPAEGGRWRLYTLAGMRDVRPEEPLCHVNYFEADAFARWAGARLPTEQEWEVAARAQPIDGNFVEAGRYHPAPAGASGAGGAAGGSPAEPRDGAAEPAPNRVADRDASVDPPASSRTDGGDEPSAPRLHQIYGDVWEWTRSQYSPYPGYSPPPGAIGEYNGKFMCNQFVLRGGSCATSRSHIRPSYRNFFPPEASWQFTGIRLAMDG